MRIFTEPSSDLSTLSRAPPSSQGNGYMTMNGLTHATLRRPPTITLIASLCMFAVGAAMGGALVRFQDALYDVAREAVIKHPEVHGFGGVEVIDQQRIAEVVEQANNAFRMLHVHGLGLGMLILLVSIAIVNLPFAEGLKKALCVLVSLGALYPPGWLILGWLIPYWGVKALRNPIEWSLFVPFGGAAILAIWGTLILYVIALVRGEPQEQAQTGRKESA